MAPGALAQVLRDLPKTKDENLLIGFDTSDDACVYRIAPGLGLIETVDFFPPMVDDPRLFGRIAAANALSDVYAMGGRPVLAMNLLCLPNCLPLEVGREILAGGAEACAAAGCAVAGGHTIEDDVPKYGLSVTGTVALDGLLANAGARPGDSLVLTKAVGTGIIATAVKGGLMAEDDAAARAAWGSMAALNEAPIRLACGLDLHGCTDVTGFGLAGHACEMAEASEVAIELDTACVPVLAGALDLAAMGIVPGGAYRNRDFFEGRVAVGEGVARELADALFDPQTSGGLLVSAAPDDARELRARLAAEGRLAALVGHVRERGAGEPAVLLR